jgi:hypothetical protein
MKNLLPYRQKTYERIRSVFRGSLTKHNFVATEGRCFKNIMELSVKSPCLWASFHPLSPLSVVSAEQWNFIKSQYEMLKLSLQCTETNYSRCTGKSSENICSSSGGARKKGKTGWNSVYHQIWWFFFWVSPSLNANVFCVGFLISPRVWPNLGLWCHVFFTSWITLMFTLFFHFLIPIKYHEGK